MDQELIDQMGQAFADIHTLIQDAEKKLYTMEEQWTKAIREMQMPENR